VFELEIGQKRAILFRQYERQVSFDEVSTITPFPDPFQTQKREPPPGSLLLTHPTPYMRANTPTALI
jgi:hypothetical protein